MKDKFVVFVPKPKEYSMIPEPQKYGFCCCCDKPRSEYDSWHNGSHCAECFASLWFDGKYAYCGLHGKKPPSNEIQKLIDSEAYKNSTLDNFLERKEVE